VSTMAHTKDSSPHQPNTNPNPNPGEQFSRQTVHCVGEVSVSSSQWTLRLQDYSHSGRCKMSGAGVKCGVLGAGWVMVRVMVS